VNQQATTVYAIPMEEGSGSSAVATTNASSVVHDPSGGGETEYVARDDMAGGGAGGAGNVNYEVMDGGGGGAAPRPGVVGDGAVVVGARAQLKRCTRLHPTDGTCKNNALPGVGGGGLFCKGHTCPECSAGKSSGAVGCPAHATGGGSGGGGRGGGMNRQ
jgi:hypothetical protein